MEEWMNDERYEMEGFKCGSCRSFCSFHVVIIFLMLT